MVILDTHAHFYPVYSAGDFLHAALSNFERHGGADAAACRLLCLVDPSGLATDAFLTETVRTHHGWTFACTGSRGAVQARAADGRDLYLLPGRQIVSRENLEILGLNCRMDTADRRFPLAGLIDAIRAAGGVPVIPWGVGKWTGARGAIVRSLIQTRRDFFLADNGNRLRGSPVPALLSEGRKQGIPVLSGSDPLPFPGESGRIATHGVRVDIASPPSDPVEAFHAAMAQPERWHVFGSGAPWPAFLKNQIRMQLRKRLG